MSDWRKKHEIMQRYDVTAPLYDMRYSEEQAAKIKAALKNLKIERHALILDAGCGTGLLFDYVADRAEATIGLDISRKTVQLAKERTKNLIGVHLVWADADNMPIRSNAFHILFAMTLIQNSPNPAKTLREIRRVAKDDAVIVVTGLKKVFSRKTFEHLLIGAGLKIVALEDEGLKCYVAVCTDVALYHTPRTNN